MPAHKQEFRHRVDLFERTVLKALSNVKDGSITVIKQDNTIIQVNIMENLNWDNTSEVGRPVGRNLKLLS